MRWTVRTPLIAFDLDGTLFRTDTVIVPAISRACADLCVPAPPESRICEAIGLPSSEFYERLFPELVLPRQRELRTVSGTYEREMLHEAGELYPGVGETLRELVSCGFHLAMFTNGSPEYANAVLERHSLANLFSWVEARVGSRPKAAALRAILGGSPCSTALVVGDRSDDVLAGRDNGCDTVGVCYGYGPRLHTDSTFQLRSIAELPAIACAWRIFAAVRLEAEAAPSTKPFIIGISGRDLSGKTSLATHLSDYLQVSGHRVQLIHLDDFHNPREVRSRGRTPVEAYIENAFDLERLSLEVLEPATRTGYVRKRLTLLDLDSDTFTKKRHVHIEPGSIVIIEGVLLFREPLDRFLDYRVFLDISADEALSRAETRDVPRFGEAILDLYREKYFLAEALYRKTHDPVGRADLHIDNTNPQRPKVVGSPAS